jgi:hypothetical protein
LLLASGVIGQQAAPMPPQTKWFQYMKYDEFGFPYEAELPGPD